MKVQATSGKGKSKGKGGKAEQQRGSRRAGEQGRSIRNPQSAIRNLRSLLLYLYLPFIGFAIPAYGQNLGRTEPEREFMAIDNPLEYSTYISKLYVPYPTNEYTLPRYDRMGNFLTVGHLVYSLDESRPGLSKAGGIAIDVYSGQTPLNFVAIRDTYKGAGFALLVAPANPALEAGQLEEGIRTRFSPLTLNMTRYAGVRFDINGPRNKGTFLYSLGSGNRYRFSFFKPGREEVSPVILWGGHWETLIGSVLRLGTTFINQHSSDATTRSGSIIHGEVPYDLEPPSEIQIRVTDDSPGDLRSVAAVYDISILVRGRDSEGNVIRLTNAPEFATGGIELASSLVPTVTGRWAGDHREARGPRERVEYRFTMPLDVRPEQVEIVAKLDGDYRVGIRHQYTYQPSTGSPKIRYWPLPSLYKHYEHAFLSGLEAPRYPTDFKFPEEDPVYTVLRAEGNPHTLGAPKTVRFDYGIPTAQTLIGTDFSLTYGTFSLDGEVAVNLQDFVFPVKEGSRNDSRHIAYYLRGKGEVPGIPQRIRPEIGGEVFHIPPQYSGGYDARRGGAIFSVDTAPGVPDGATQEFNLYDDNDDGDQWPDDHPNDSAQSLLNDAGVFPGLDENEDNVIDTDQNDNAKPDWTEPFLFYTSDPPEFLYDVDFNNNGLPDLIENDDEPDYPYRRDQRGWHLFTSFSHLIPGIKRVSFGLYEARQIAGGGESRVRYVRINGDYPIRSWGELGLRCELKRVRDDISDPSYLWQVSEDASVNMLVVQSKEKISYARILDMRPPPPDPLLMRNSTVTTLFAKFDLAPLKGLEMRTRNQFVLNRQHPETFFDGTSQGRSTLDRVTLSNRIGYTYHITKKLFARAKVKHLFRRDRGYADSTRVYFSDFAPILETGFRLTERTILQFGQEGLPFWSFYHRDLVNPDENYKRRTGVFLVRMDSLYWGWVITSELGIQFQTLEPRNRRALSQRFSFVEVYVGF